MPTTTVLRPRWATTGAKVNPARYMSRTMKLVMEASVRNVNPQRAGALPEPGSLRSTTGYARYGHAARQSRRGVQSAQPGVQPATYRTKGSSWEHGNLDSSAGPAKPGKLPSPATSRTRGGAFVVVRARESRAHGEGRQ
jgi:hypothetical protein